jgi:hypothetical protein
VLFPWSATVDNRRERYVVLPSRTPASGTSAVLGSPA